MGVSEFVQPDVEVADALVDPGVVAAGLRCGTAGDDSLESGVDGDGEGIGAHRARQPRGNAKAVERNHAAHFRLDPEQGRIVGTLGHRKDAAGISAQQHFGRDFGRGGVACGHGWEDSRVRAGVRWGGLSLHRVTAALGPCLSTIGTGALQGSSGLRQYARVVQLKRRMFAGTERAKRLGGNKRGHS